MSECVVREINIDERRGGTDDINTTEGYDAGWGWY